MKKKIIILSILLLVLSVLAFLSFMYSTQIKRLYVRYTTDISEGTGAVQATPNPQVEAEGKAINSLQKALPVNQPKFTITSYDYGKGLFEVELTSTAASVDFETWYQSSGYSSIPRDMFYFK